MNIRIYIALDSSLLDSFNSKVKTFNLAHYIKDYDESIFRPVSISMLDSCLSGVGYDMNEYKNIIAKKNNFCVNFRNGFYVYTTQRFFYIEAICKMFNLTSFFHIENDIMFYQSFERIMTSMDHTNKMWMVQDSEHRVIPSVVFIPNYDSIRKLNTFIMDTTRNVPEFINDMGLLAMFPDKHKFPIHPNGNLMFDGAAIGQYLGGIDVDNVIDKYNTENKQTPPRELIECINPTIGFINETSDFKPNTEQFSWIEKCTSPKNSPPLRKLYCNSDTAVSNLHVHSKQLYQFSSIFNTSFRDIVTGDRILGLADVTILTKPIYEYHTNIQKFTKNIIMVKDFDNIENIESVNKLLTGKSNNNVIKLFIYTHIFLDFIDKMFPKLDQTLNYIFYVHNSDHIFDDTYADKVLPYENVMCVYAQNINCKYNSRFKLLPIGIANNMFPHGDLFELYKVMRETYHTKKTKDIYININPDTYFYRRAILEQLVSSSLKMSSNKPYTEYLYELASHKYCLCIRGNGIDTHRFWESLYLGVIPIIINNPYTNCSNFVQYLKTMNIPFIDITDFDTTTIVNKLTDIVKGKVDDTINHMIPNISITNFI